MINSELRPFINCTPINSTGITIVDLGELHEGVSDGVEVPRSSSVPPISLLRPHGVGEDRHGSLPPMTQTAISSRMSNFAVEEDAQGVGETDSYGSNALAGPSSHREPEDGGTLRSSQVSKAKEDHSI